MTEDNKKEQEKQENEICGIIMPISGSDGYPEKHWSEIRAILDEVIISAGFIPNMVSDADEIGIIHNRIVSNIYNNPIVICDVSSKNANVMFELGLRLAFDKPTIIVKDNITNYTFDAGIIEHVNYPRDKNYHEINDFKAKLKSKIQSTYEKSKNPAYSTFLKNFVQYKRKLDEKEVGPEELILKKIDQMNSQISHLQSQLGLLGSQNTIDVKDLFDAYELFYVVGDAIEEDSVRKIRIKFRQFLEKYNPKLLAQLISESERYRDIEHEIIKKLFSANSSISGESKKGLLNAIRDKYGDKYIIDEYKDGQ